MKNIVQFPPQKNMQFHYPKSRIYTDLIRSGLGVLLSVAVLFAAQALWWVNIIFAIIGAFFALYFMQTIGKWKNKITIGGDTIAIGQKSIAWENIRRIKLRHYGGNKYSTILGASFFELSVFGEDTKITCDSGLIDFKKIPLLLVHAAQKYNIAIDDNSAHNLAYFANNPESS